MCRTAPWTLAFASLVVLAAIAGSPRSSGGVETQDLQKKEAPKAAEPTKEAAKPDDKATLEFRVLATKKHDAEAIEKAIAPDGFKNPPMGFRWAPVSDNSVVANIPTAIVRDESGEGGKAHKYVLVKLDRQNVTETDLARLSRIQDEQIKPAIQFELTPSGGRRFGRLTREHLPEDGGVFRHYLAVILDGTVRSVPVIVSEVPHSGVIQGLGTDDVDRLITRLKNASIDAKAYEDSLKQFQDAKLGLFVRWGPFASLGKGEWVMDNDKMPLADYEKLAAKFNPDQFNADAWVKAVKDAGAKYLTVSVKDHDGFCLYDSRLTKYDIVDTSTYGKDPIKPLADACRKGSIRLVFAYSLLDWHHPDYFPRGKSGHSAGREEKGDWKSYVSYYQGQLRELCINYGDIGGIWLDGWWDRPDADWDLDTTYRMIHELQPGALVANNHQRGPFPCEDFLTSEAGVSADSPSAATTTGPAKDLPREIYLSLNNSRAYVERDKNYKKAEQLIQTLVQSVGQGSNLLLNVGIKPDGTWPAEATERLTEVGKWLAKNGDSIYGTRRGPITQQPWGTSVRKDDVVYLHILKPAEKVVFPMSDSYDFGFAELFGGRKAQGFGYSKSRLTGTIDGKEIKDASATIHLSTEARTPIDTIVVLKPAGAKPEEPKKEVPAKKAEVPAKAAQ
jgi:alpha-L-fucosidase